MNLNNVFICDIECDSLLDDLTKLHVLSLSWKKDGEWQIKSTNKKEDVIRLVSNPNNTLVGHFFLGFDIPAIKKLYNCEIKAQIIDTLSLSHYLYNDRQLHSLESWGETLGFAKVKVDDSEWRTITYERAKERCQTDALINRMLWEKCLGKLRELYSTDEEIIPVIKRANWKIILQHIQSNNKILVDIEQCKKNLAFLEEIVDKKTKELESVMPKIPVIRKVNKPTTLYKKGGVPSVAGTKWFELLKDKGLPVDYNGEIEVISSYTEPNASSHQQMKDFLFSKGWKPILFKKGANGKVPQLRDDEKNLCKSVVKLIKDNPELEALDGLSVASHRAGYLKSFLNNADENGYITASWSGMAKTWRVKHLAPVVNLPANNSLHGELVRSVLIAPKGKVWVNADLASLEDKTKQVCIYPFDPEYVETLNTKGYDAHLSIGLKAKLLTENDVSFYRWYKNKEGVLLGFEKMTEAELNKNFNRVYKIRHSAKQVNYAATYMAQPRKLSEIADISLKEATILHTAYWETNKSIKEFVETLQVKVVDDQNWVYNPHTKLWLLLTQDHMKFSAVNQNFGNCVFDLFVYYLVEAGVKPILTYHDEISWYIDEGQEEETKMIVKECMDKVNKAYNYPIKFESTPEFAKSYGSVH